MGSHPARSPADRSLLFALLALQMGFIDREQMVRAMNAWSAERDMPLGEILLMQKALEPAGYDLIEAVVRAQLARHGGDVQRSLQALELTTSVRQALGRVANAEMLASLGRTGAATDVTNAFDTPPMKRGGQEVPDTPRAGGRFRVVRPHARGGLGEVFVARDEELGRLVALKEIQLRYADDAESRARFLQEGQITGGLEHPGVVPVYGLGTYPDGRPFYAMRFIRGESMKEAIARFYEDGARSALVGGRALEFRKLLGRFVAVCEAVAYAHSRGVLHRDLKPANVMLGKYGETLVVDWGLAKAVGRADPDIPATAGDAATADDTLSERTIRPEAGGSTPTEAGQALGTPAYMSPEQAEGRWDEVGPAADVYGLGATLYHLLTGQAAFKGDVANVVADVLKGRFPKPSSIRPGVPRALEAVCLKAMALAPKDRYGAARDLADDVEHWLADEPVSARPDALSSRAARWSRHHRPWVAGAAALLVTGLAVTSASSVLLGRANARANEQRDRALLAEQAAKEKEETATRAAAEARAVLDFFRNKVLAAARPKGREGGLGPEATIRAAVDLAAPQIARDFAEQPLVEAAIHDTLGTTYHYCGDFPVAIEQQKQAQALRATHLGPDHPDTLATMNNLANSLLRAGKVADAVALYQRTLASRKAVLGSDHPETLRTQDNLATAFALSGKLPESVPLFEENLKIRRAKLGPEHPDTLATMNNLANAYCDVGRLADAIPLQEETLKLRRAKLGPEHPETLGSMNNLADAYHETGRVEDAISLYKETLALLSAKEGPNHPDTLLCMHNLAVSYRDADRVGQAIPLHEAALRLRKAKLGPEHFETLRSMSNLASDYSLAGRDADALALYEETLKLQKATLGQDHTDTVETMSGLAALRMRRAEFTAGESLLQDALKASLKRQEAAPLESAAIRAQLGECLLREGRFGDAEAMLRACLDVRRKQSPNDWQTFETQSVLGDVLIGQGKYAEAESLLVAGYEGLREREGKMTGRDRVHIRQAGERLVRLYDSWGKKTRADDWRKRLEAALPASAPQK